MSKTPLLTSLGKNGRIVIPAKLRRQLGLKPGMSLQLMAEDERLVVTRPQEVWERLQQRLSPYSPKKSTKLVSEQLLQERRQEAKQEGL